MIRIIIVVITGQCNVCLICHGSIMIMSTLCLHHNVLMVCVCVCVCVCVLSVGEDALAQIITTRECRMVTIND